MRYKFVMILLAVIIVISIYETPAFAHRSGCHRWHSCPSDTGSYTCGDTGYCSQCPDNQYCKAGNPITPDTVTYTNPSTQNVTPTVPSRTFTGTILVDHDTISLPTLEPSFIKITGQINDQPRGNPVTITITKPDKSTDVLNIFTSQSGYFLTNIQISKDSQVGTYSVTATYQGSTIDTTSFTVKSAQSTNSDTTTIPVWIKNNAKWWYQGTITDEDFKKTVQYLIQQKIIKITSTTTSQDLQNIPSWVKNMAGAWSSGATSDKDFLQGLEYLVQHGIIRV